jgi:hypothetical protein
MAAGVEWRPGLCAGWNGATAAFGITGVRPKISRKADATLRAGFPALVGQGGFCAGPRAPKTELLRSWREARPRFDFLKAPIRARGQRPSADGAHTITGAARGETAWRARAPAPRAAVDAGPGEGSDAVARLTLRLRWLLVVLP